MKTQEALACSFEDSSERFTLLHQEKKRIEAFFALEENKRRKDFFEVYQCYIGQLERFEIPEDDKNIDLEIFQRMDSDISGLPLSEEDSSFVLTSKGFFLLKETFVSCFVPEYWNLHQLISTIYGGPACQRFSILLFKSEEAMKEHMRTYPNMYQYCIDPSGVRREIKIRIEIDLEKD